MKRIVVFSESDSDSDFRHVDIETPIVKRKKKAKRDTDHSSEDCLKEGDKVQLSIVESLRKACDKENVAKKKRGNTLDNYFNAFGAKSDVSRKKVSVDEFFSNSSLGKKRAKTEEHSSPHISPLQPVSADRDAVQPLASSKLMSPKEEISDKAVKPPPTTASHKKLEGFPAHSDAVQEQRSSKPAANATKRSPAVPKPFWAYQGREGPRALGSKPIPKGTPSCLNGKFFVITGVLDSIERDDVRALIERCGGKVLKTLGKKTTYLVVGREPGERKLAKAETMNVRQLNEDELFALIRELAGEPLDSIHQPGLSPSSKSSGSATILTPPKPAHSVCKLTAKPVILTLSPPNKPDNSQTLDSVAPSLSRGVESVLWVDKYKPTSRRQLIGQTGDHSPANRLYNWLSNWHSHFSAGAKARAYSTAPPWASGGSTDDGKWARAALLSGPPGIGKTSAAFVVCSELLFSTCELNASDSRSKKSLQEEISEVLYTQSVAHFATQKASQLNSKHSVLLMDEVDGMAGNEDRGGIQELINMIKSTRVPIICMCNDRQSPKIRSLANYCLDLRFHRPRVEQIKAAVMSILYKENVTIPPTVLNEIILASNHDIRQIINNTQMWCSSGLVDQTQLISDAAGAQKDLHLGAFDVIRKVFALDFPGPNGGPASINDSLELFFQDYSLIPLFVQENYLNVKSRASQNDPKRVLQLLSRAANEMALGDVVGATIRTAGTGYWSLLPVQGIFSVVLPGRLLHGPLPGGGPGGGVNFPSWFGKYSHQGRMQRVSASLSHHLSLSTHGSCCNSRNLILDYASPLSDSLTRPLKQGDTDTVLNTLIAHQLQREDMDSLLQLTTWSNLPNRLTCIDSKVKAALTRTFNRSSHLLPYATTIEPKTRGNRGPTNTLDVITEYDDLNPLFDASEAISVADDVEDLDDLEKDGMIVQNKKMLSKQKTNRSPSEKGEKVSQSMGKPVCSSKSSRGRGRKIPHSTA